MNRSVAVSAIPRSEHHRLTELREERRERETGCIFHPVASFGYWLLPLSCPLNDWWERRWLVEGSGKALSNVAGDGQVGVAKHAANSWLALTTLRSVCFVFSEADARDGIRSFVLSVGRASRDFGAFWKARAVVISHRFWVLAHLECGLHSQRRTTSLALARSSTKTAPQNRPKKNNRVAPAIQAALTCTMSSQRHFVPRLFPPPPPPVI